MYSLDPPQAFGPWLQCFIYDGRPLSGVLHWPLAGFGICLLGFVAVGAYLDHAHNKEARNGAATPRSAPHSRKKAAPRQEQNHIGIDMVG